MLYFSDKEKNKLKKFSGFLALLKKQ